MKRYCFVLEIKPEYVDKYIEMHEKAWPEILQAGKDTGAENLIIYMYDNFSIVFFECEDIDAFYEAYGKLDAVKRWNEVTGPFIQKGPIIDGTGKVKTLRKVYDLKQQIEGELLQY